MQNHGNTASDYTKILENTDHIDRAMLAVKGIARVIEANHVLTDSGQEGFIDSYIMSGLTAALDLAAVQPQERPPALKPRLTEGPLIAVPLINPLSSHGRSRPNEQAFTARPL